MGTQEAPNEKCIFCTRTERLLAFDQIEPGAHIRFGDGNFLYNIFKRNVSIFAHHAIVTAIETLNPTSANLTIISFVTSSTDGHILVREVRKNINLVFENIHIIRYGLQTSPKCEIIQRAKSLLQSGERYSLFWNNCEHLANYCCTGIKMSNQVYDFTFHLKEMAKSAVQNLVELILKIAKVSLDDITDTAFTKNIICQGKAVSVFTLIYLLYCTYQHIELYKDTKNSKICGKCCREKQRYMWTKFLIYCSAQVDSAFIISLVISTGVCGNAVLGVKAVLVLASAAMMWAFPSLRHSLASPFKGKSERVESLTQISRGDVISFKKHRLMHDGIVSKVELHANGKMGLVRLVHYSSASMYGRRTIVEEQIILYQDKTVVKRHNYSGYEVYEPDIVVKRALQRVGEAKYGFLTNRSCHFCHWAKVKEAVVTQAPGSPEVLEYDRSLSLEESISPFSFIAIDQRQNRQIASSNLEQTWARIREDIRPGLILRLKIKGHRHYAVSTDVDYSNYKPSVLTVTVVYRDADNFLIEDMVEVDLNTEHVWIYKYHPVYQYSQGEIITRARQKVGNRKCGKFEGSFKLPEEIVRKKRDTRIDSFRAIKAGDVIVFYYWSMKHPAIVTDVLPTESHTTAYVTVVHYGSDSLFAQSTVREECLFMNLNKDDIFLKDYDGFVTYPRCEVVQRAQSIKGEQRFSILGNTSWELVHWAKVVQKPAIVTKTPKHSSAGIETSKESDHGISAPKTYLLLPNAGDTYGHFQRHPVRKWTDLKPGMIVEFRSYFVYHQGILTEVREDEGAVVIIYFQPYSLLPMESIIEETIHVDLKRDDIWMYVCDPTKANKASVVLANARKCLQEQTVRFRRGSWTFCLECVLKENSS